MILVILQMKVPSKKRMELSQTISALSGSIRMEKGCKCCDFCQSIEDENRLFLLEEWDTQENLMTHLKSVHFKVLRGAMSLLQEPFERMFYEKIAKSRTTFYDSEVVDTCMSLFNEKDFKMEG
ncbi:MAG: antibiotic biosynthesis monooxygenase [Deltaproteobacteria bacterium]|nr:antibiotic biosynthesis monooxygenase [Deltaproteobacteria bacterium]